MAINLGGFGNVIARPAARPTYQANTAVGDALQTFGKIAGEIAAKEKQKMDRAIAAKKTSEFEIEADELLNTTQQMINQGNIRPDEVETYFGDRINELRNTKLKDVSGDLKDTLSTAFDIGSAKYRVRARDVQAGFVKQGQIAEMMQTRENLERLALTDMEGAQAQWDAVLDSVGKEVLNPVEIQKERQSFKEKATFNAVASQLESTNSIAAVRSMEEKLANPEFMASLTPEGRLQLRNAAQSKRRELKAEADRQRRENEALMNERANTYVNILASGLPVAAELRSEMNRFTQGGGRAGKAVGEVLSNYDLIRQQQLRPLSEQATDLRKLQRQVESETDAKRRATLQERLQVLSQSYSNGRKRFEQDPIMAYAEVTGTEIPPIDLSGPQGFAATIQQRAQYAVKARGMTGRPVDLLTNAEAAQFATSFAQMSTAQQADILKSVRAAGGSDAALSLAGALSKVNPTYGFAAYHAAKNGITNKGRGTASIMLQGAKAAIKLPDATEKSIQAKLQSVVGESFQGRSSDFMEYMNGAVLAYKALSEDANDMAGSYKSSRADEAISIALGTKPIAINDRKVLPPVGYDPSKFRQTMLTGIERIGRDVYKLDSRALAGFTEDITLIPSDNDTYTLLNGKTNAVMIYPADHPRAGTEIRLRAR